MSTADLSDRLHAVLCELTILADAMSDINLDPIRRNGFHIILDRQIDEISALKSEIHPNNKEIAVKGGC